MKVILLQKVPGIGDVDDVKEVADGYARNFLFPRNLAVQASSAATAQVSAHKKKLIKEAENDLQEQQSLAVRLDGLVIEIKEKASDKGLLYAAIGPQRLVEELKKRGFVVVKSQVTMKPIKEAGEFQAIVRLRHGLEADVGIIVSA
jgi:large subunit ribosomal protein L9